MYVYIYICICICICILDLYRRPGCKGDYCMIRDWGVCPGYYFSIFLHISPVNLQQIPVSISWSIFFFT